MRIFAVSDLHIDYRPNFAWLMQLSRMEYRDDILILAGDVSDKIDRLEACLKHLSLCFKQVVYVPGNHDLWVGKRQGMTSFDKFNSILEMANAYSVATRPYTMGSLTIVPLFSWYDYSFGACSEYLQQRWMDYFLCDWGVEFEHLPLFGEKERAINQVFHQINAPYLSIKNETMVSFSHFLPRIDVMPDYIPPIHQQLYPILGSWQLDKQIRALGSQLHVYGHSHVNRHELIDGISYINNAFGNPGEERIARKQLQCIMEC